MVLLKCEFFLNKIQEINWKKSFSPKRITIYLLMIVGIILINVLIWGSCPDEVGNLFTQLCASVSSGKEVLSVGTAIEHIGFSIGGLFALLLATASFERVRALDETAKAQNKVAEAQEKGNIEERYKNAIIHFPN